MKEKICLEHERRISSNESFIQTVKDNVKDLKVNMSKVLKHLYIGMGALGLLQLFVGTNLPAKLLSHIIETAYALF